MLLLCNNLPPLLPSPPPPTRDVSSVELLIKYHQGIRSEIDTRDPKFTDCVDLGRALITRKHRDSAEVRLRGQGVTGQEVRGSRQ